MLSIVYYPLLACSLYIFYHVVKYVQNTSLCLKTGFPTVHVPLIQQNHPFWVIMGPISRHWLKRNLPTWLFNRISLTIYGLEFFQGTQPWEDYVYPQLESGVNVRGNGKTYMLVTGGKPEMWTWDAEIASDILSRYGDFVSFDAARVVLAIFGHNVFTVDGAVWRRHRRVVAGAVTEKVSSIVWDESVRQTRALHAAVAKLGGSTNQTFDMTRRVTIHVLYAAGMGNEQDFDSEQTTKTQKLLDGTKMSYIDAVKIVNENTSGPTILPTSILSNYPSFLPGAAWMHELGQAKIDFPKHTRAALANEKQLVAETGKIRNNVLSALVAASEQNEGNTDSGKKGPALSDEELVGNLYVFTAAGFDTTANTIAFTLVLLLRHPKWQEWLIEELDAILPQDPEADLDYTSIFPRANRALAIMLEVLRIFPPVIHVVKQTDTQQTVTTPGCGTFRIPGGTTVYINSIMLHTDPAVWRNLNMTELERRSASDDEDGLQGDEYDFRPSRWINVSGSTATMYQPAKGTYLPWSTGARVCPGSKMAQVEFVGMLVTLFSRHRMEVVRKTVPVKGAPDVQIPESDDALNKRLDALMADATPKLTLEMDVYNIKAGEDRGLGINWVKRK